MAGVDGVDGVEGAPRAVDGGPSAVDDVLEAEVVAVWSLLSFLEPVLVSNKELRMSWLRENFSCDFLGKEVRFAGLTVFVFLFVVCFVVFRTPPKLATAVAPNRCREWSIIVLKMRRLKGDLWGVCFWTRHAVEHNGTVAPDAVF